MMKCPQAVAHLLLQADPSSSLPTPSRLLKTELDLLDILHHRSRNQHGSARWFRHLRQARHLLRQLSGTVDLLLLNGYIVGIVSDLETHSAEWQVSAHRSVLLADSDSVLNDKIRWRAARALRHASFEHGMDTMSISEGKSSSRVQRVRCTELINALVYQTYKLSMLLEKVHMPSVTSLLAQGQYVQIALIGFGCLARIQGILNGFDSADASTGDKESELTVIRDTKTIIAQPKEDGDFRERAPNSPSSSVKSVRSRSTTLANSKLFTAKRTEAAARGMGLQRMKRSKQLHSKDEIDDIFG
ncbi:hypothetical protein PYCC9005_000034 [Savitreella phatthalungensis]